MYHAKKQPETRLNIKNSIMPAKQWVDYIGTPWELSMIPLEFRRDSVGFRRNTLDSVGIASEFLANAVEVLSSIVSEGSMSSVF